MAYTDIISLTDAKNYLRIDDGFTADDAQITGMIKASLRYVEKLTNHILFAQSKDYLLINGCAKVYDFPINSITTPTDAEQTESYTYSNFKASTTEETLKLDVGYASASDVPDELVQYAYFKLKFYYFEAKDDNKGDGKIPKWAEDSINQYRRFIF